MNRETAMQKRFMEVLLYEYMDAQGGEESAEVRKVETEIKKRHGVDGGCLIWR